MELELAWPYLLIMDLDRNQAASSVPTAVNVLPSAFTTKTSNS